MKIQLNDLNTGGTVLFVEEEHSDSLFDVLFEDLQLRVTEFLRRAAGHGVGVGSPANAQAHMKYHSMIVVPDKAAHELAEILAEKFNGELLQDEAVEGFTILVEPYDPLD